MLFPPLIVGRLIARRNRFLVDVQLPSGACVTAHCANTGSMRSCLAPGWRVALSRSGNPNRRLPYTLELAHNGRVWIAVNTQLANRAAAELLAAGAIPELPPDAEILPEQPMGAHSRVDFLLRTRTCCCYIEVKSVTQCLPGQAAAFPDAVTARGLKHLHDLCACVQAGHQALMLYLVLRRDVTHFRPAAEIDPAYSAAWQVARASGVMMQAFVLAPTLRGFRAPRSLPIRLTDF